MLSFLEKAGLVTIDTPEEQAPAATAPPPAQQAPAAPPAPGAATVATVPGPPLNLDAIYADGGIAPCLYPAERLLRLLDGLSAMDEATRRLAVAAMDAADESWSIEDPLADAAAKVQVLAAQGQRLQANQQTLQAQTQARLDAIASRQDQVVGGIRKQISELEALIEREVNRAAQERSQLQAELQAAQDQTARELGEMAQWSARLQGLSTQFSNPNPAPKE
ncbi:MAG: methyl-accepting chemotaxis protein [Rhodoferax sp.]